MTECEAREWIHSRFGSGGVRRCERFVEMVRSESANQNLVAAATLSSIWFRHVVDSAQLIDAAHSDGHWLDVGTGAGFPGMIVALLRDGPMVLVEPRRLRATFLSTAASHLGLTNVTVMQSTVAQVGKSVDVISARAVAKIDTLLTWTAHIADNRTTWLLSKGKEWRADLAEARRRWVGVFHVKNSVTSTDGAIIVAANVQRR